MRQTCADNVRCKLTAQSLLERKRETYLVRLTRARMVHYEVLIHLTGSGYGLAGGDSTRPMTKASDHDLRWSGR